MPFQGRDLSERALDVADVEPVARLDGLGTEERTSCAGGRDPATVVRTQLPRPKQGESHLRHTHALYHRRGRERPWLAVRGVGGPCRSEVDAQALLAKLRSIKRFGKATHHSWALITADGMLKADDGEGGAGAVVVRMVERAGLQDHIVIVSR